MFLCWLETLKIVFLFSYLYFSFILERCCTSDSSKEDNPNRYLMGKEVMNGQCEEVWEFSSDRYQAKCKKNALKSQAQSLHKDSSRVMLHILTFLVYN